MYYAETNYENRPLYSSNPPRIRFFCRLCGAPLTEADRAFRFSGKVICESCVCELSVRQILRICEFSSHEELLCALGFTEI